MAPFSIIDRSGFLITSHAVIDRAEHARRGGEVRVEGDVREEPDAAEVDASVEPALKPNQPNQRMTTPSVVKAML